MLTEHIQVEEPIIIQELQIEIATATLPIALHEEAMLTYEIQEIHEILELQEILIHAQLEQHALRVQQDLLELRDRHAQHVVTIDLLSIDHQEDHLEVQCNHLVAE